MFCQARLAAAVGAVRSSALLLLVFFFFCVLFKLYLTVPGGFTRHRNKLQKLSYICVMTGDGSEAPPPPPPPPTVPSVASSQVVVLADKKKRKKNVQR